MNKELTPKEKAQELFDKYFDQMVSFGFYLSNRQISKIAIIAVDEITDRLIWHTGASDLGNTILIEDIKYYQEVKQEILNQNK